jgi:hypothetical protein
VVEGGVAKNDEDSFNTGRFVGVALRGHPIVDLFVSQRNQRINFRCSARRDVARQQCDDSQ